MNVSAHIAVNRPPPGAVPLQLQGKTNIPLDGMYENVRAAQASGFPILQDRGRITQQPIVIVGDSPDLEQHAGKIAELRASGAKILAVKRTHDWLIERGIVPDYAVCSDGQRCTVDVFRARDVGIVRRSPGITYLAASISHPDMWEYLRGQAVLIWHPHIDGRQRVLPEWAGVKKVYGGSTTGLRSISLAYILGHRNQVLVGMSSCVAANGAMRATGGKVFDFDAPFPVHYAGRWFWMTAALAQQVNDLMGTLRLCPGIKVDVIGDGALPHVLRTGKAAGWPV